MVSVLYQNIYENKDKETLPFVDRHTFWICYPRLWSLPEHPQDLLGAAAQQFGPIPAAAEHAHIPWSCFHVPVWPQHNHSLNENWWNERGQSIQWEVLELTFHGLLLVDKLCRDDDWRTRSTPHLKVLPYSQMKTIQLSNDYTFLAKFCHKALSWNNQNLQRIRSDWCTIML